MKFLLILTSLLTLSYSNVKETVAYVYDSYIVYDLNTNKILEGSNYYNTRSVASISKIMTAVLAIESGMLENFIKAPKEIEKVDGSSVYLEVGEANTLEELVYGLMLRSGNDCAVTIAYSVSGSLEAFVNLMNYKAQQIGMKNTLFRNPSGLDEEDGGNLSSCFDMALLSSYAMKLETFRKITSTKAYRSSNHGIWINKNKLLNTYDKAIGGKTGYTRKARRTLVTMAKEEDTELVIVTFNCGSDFSFHKNMYEKWFKEYKTYLLISKGEHYIEDYHITCEENVYDSFKNNNNPNIIYHILNKEMLIYTDQSKHILGKCKVNGRE